MLGEILSCLVIEELIEEDERYQHMKVRTLPGWSASTISPSVLGDQELNLSRGCEV